MICETLDGSISKICSVTVTAAQSTNSDNNNSGSGSSSGSTSGSTDVASGGTGNSIGGNTGTSDSSTTNLDTGVEDSSDQPVSEPEKTIAIGDKIIKGKVTYMVIDVEAKEVAYIKTTSKSSTITIPATVTIDGVTYKVTKIAVNAFKNNKYVTKIILGSNIVEIGASVFKGCSKLKSLTISSKVKLIGSGAFSGDKKLATLNIKSGKLTKKGVKNALKGSYIKTVKLSDTAKNNYKKYVKYFAKSNSGKQVKIRK